MIQPLEIQNSALISPHMPEDSTHFYNLAIDAVQAGQLENAISHTESALIEDPKDSLSWQLYVNLLTAAGRTGDAATAREKLLAMGISGKEKRMIEASEQLAGGNLDRAIDIYQQAAAENPEDVDIHASLALALFQNGNREPAIEAGRKAVVLSPSDSRANYVLGHMLRLEGRKDEALEALTRAVDAEADFMPAIYEQGMIFAEKGQLEKALANFETFSAAHPEDENARLAISNIRKELGRTDTY